MPLALAPAHRLAGTGDQICTLKQSAKLPHGVETVVDLTTRIRGSVKPCQTSLAQWKRAARDNSQGRVKKLAEYASVKVATEIAHKAIDGSKKDFWLVDGMGLGILDPEEEGLGYSEPQWSRRDFNKEKQDTGWTNDACKR